jgi:hypothetical protein
VPYNPDECNGDYIRTYSGIDFHPLNTNINEIDIYDIAHALSNLCRWNGHCNEFYSVGQHSVLVSELCPKKYSLWGLLHDAPEAYIGDMSRPFKLSGRMEEYRKIEDRIMSVIADKFNLKGNAVPLAVKEVDHKILQTEAINILKNPWQDCISVVPYGFKIKPVHPRVANNGGKSGR